MTDGTAHQRTADALADKILDRVADALSGLQREMDVMKWPAEFRAIMWQAVALEAGAREAEQRARLAHGELSERITTNDDRR